MKEVFGAAQIGLLLPEGFQELEVCGVVGSRALMQALLQAAGWPSQVTPGPSVEPGAQLTAGVTWLTWMSHGTGKPVPVPGTGFQP
jgi:hypothetical protein